MQKWANSNYLAATTILLYSRLNGMIVVFTIQSPQSSTSQAISTSDPLLLSFSNMRPALGINDLAFRAVPYGFNHTKHPSGSGQLYFESGVKFYKLVIFFYDMSLSESLYAEAIEGSDIKIDSPSSRTRKTKLMTPARVSDDFIIADGFEDDDSAEAPSEVNDERLLEPETSSRSRLSDQKARSINFEWLAKGSRRTLGESTVTATGNLNDILEGLYDMIKNQGNTDIPTMATLYVEDAQSCSLLCLRHTDRPLGLDWQAETFRSLTLTKRLLILRTS